MRAENRAAEALRARRAGARVAGAGSRRSRATRRGAARRGPALAAVDKNGARERKNIAQPQSRLSVHRQCAAEDAALACALARERA